MSIDSYLSIYQVVRRINAQKLAGRTAMKMEEQRRTPPVCSSTGRTATNVLPNGGTPSEHEKPLIG